MHEEAHRAVGQPVRLLAVELGVVDVPGLRVVERVVRGAEALLGGVGLFLVHLRPQHAVNRNALGAHRREELLHRDAVLELLNVQHERRPPEGALALRSVQRRDGDERMAGQVVDEIAAVAAAGGQVPGVEALQFAEADHRLHLGHAEVEAHAAMDVELLALHLKEVHLRANIVSVVAERAELPGQVVVIGDHHAAFAARGEVLALAEGEAPHVADGAGLLALVDAAEARHFFNETLKREL